MRVAYRIKGILLGDPMLFSELSGFYTELESVSSRLTMMEIMGKMFSKIGISEVSAAIYMTEGILLPPFEGLEFGIAEKLMVEAIAKGTGYEKKEVNDLYKKLGDLGSTAESLKSKSHIRRMQEHKYTVNEVYSTMLSIAKESGQGSKDKKITILADLIASSTPQEAKYIVRYPLGALRLGAGDSTILEALSIAYTGSRDAKADLENAYNLCSDLGYVGESLLSNGIKSIKAFKPTLFKPLRPALAERLPTAEEILEKTGGKAAVEQKYDGFRVQIHKKGDRVQIYSRRQENVTEMFPDITAAVRSEIPNESIIFEGEALASNEATGEFLPFQETIQRKRKHGISEKSAELPLSVMAFDILYLDGTEMLTKPYTERRRAIEKLFSNKKVIRPTRMEVISEPKALEEFFEQSVENGLEGIMAKDLSAQYSAGARKFSWIKLKRSYRGELSDTVDLVIVGYYLGKGSRAEFGFGGLLCAVYNEEKDVFETISRIGTGFTESQMQELKEKLSRIKQKSRPPRVDSIVEPDFWVSPKYVVTINADEITRSPMHTCGRSADNAGVESGYALRFPRLVGNETIRSDKGPEDSTTTKEIIEMFKSQKRVGSKP